jgi:predicted O-methyltransferase YrrM
MAKSKEIERYILDHIEPEEAILKEIDRYTNLKLTGARMLSGHIQGLTLSMISKMIKPQYILEIGTFTGYSAICLSRGLVENGKLVTIETNDEMEIIASGFFEKAGLKDKIELKIGNALNIIPTLGYEFDLVFLDADKREYLQYYKAVLKITKPGGFIVADNTLWSGKVVEPLMVADEQTQGIIAFNEFLKNDMRVEKVILPIRDGMTIIRKKEN